MIFKRVVLIVLDGVGCGALPDADEYGDVGANTLGHVARDCGGLRLPTLQRLGLGNIVDMVGVPRTVAPLAAWGRMVECSVGKDSTTGHWEMAGAEQKRPFATYPHGFPAEIIAAFTRLVGKKPLGNVVINGIEAIARYGEQHLETGRPIVYTSIDSVFQIAAHEQVIPPEQLYAICRSVRTVLDPYRVGRVIARPFIGTSVDNFQRTVRRHDFSLQPPNNILDQLFDAGFAVTAVGKIDDIFCGRGISTHYFTENNRDGMVKITTALHTMDCGLVFANLIDSDMLYGHQCDVHGFAAALEEFDRWLEHFLPHLNSDDLLLITADHGCDPTTAGTDHSREYVPLLVWSPRQVAGQVLGTRRSFSDIAATLAHNFNLHSAVGESFLSQLIPCG
ncbi:MAG: phosphopentomutase [Thermodesulfobacteriota bacterium]|nr:phosphopentomutase [Thermodesulfobacteriota bacterium]